MTDWVVLHEKIRGRSVCAIGTICGAEPIVAIGVADDDDDERPRQTKHGRAGLRALRKIATKAAPIVTAAVPGGAAAREATKVLLEARRAASDVETHGTHGAAVSGLLTPLAVRAIGQVSPASAPTYPANVRALIDRYNAMGQEVQRLGWTLVRRYGRRSPRILSSPDGQRMLAIVRSSDELLEEIDSLGWEPTEESFERAASAAFSRRPLVVVFQRIAEY